MGSLMVSGIQANYDGLDTQNMLESRMIMGGSGDEEDEAAARSLFKTNVNANLNAPGRDAVSHNFLNSQISSRAFQMNQV